jgi:subtilisin family serine protease
MTQGSTLPRRPMQPGRFLLVSISLLALSLSSPAFARTLPEALGDTRVDFALRAMMRQADWNAQHGVTISPAGAPANGMQTTGEGAALVGSPDSPGVLDGGELPTTTVNLLLDGDVQRGDLERLGVDVNTQAGGVTTAIAPLALVPALLDTPGLTGVHPAFPMHKLLDVSAQAIDATAAWGGTPPTYSGASGKRVVVGIIDTGIDLNHADFKDASNNTRIKYLWDQTAFGTKPVGFTYGVEYTSAQINAHTCPETDDDGHGTWVAGIAAGNGRATGNSQPNYHYVGVAPEADLIIVKAMPYESGKLDAVNYVFQRAAALGEPAVVNISWGTNVGGHDGGYALDQAISALTGPGKLVAAAAGNNNNLGMHGRINLAAGATTTVQVNVPSYTQTTSTPENVYIEAWHDASASFDIKLTSPSGISTPLLSPGASNNNQSTTDGEIYVENDVQSTTRSKRIYAYFYRGVTYHPAAGAWKLTVTRRSGTTSGVCDFWISNWSLLSSTYPAFVTPVKDESRTVTSPATADSVLATGAYSSRLLWVNGNGATSLVPGAPVVGTVASFSSLGPRRDGKICPDFVAPGNDVISALSATLAPYESNAWKALDQVHYADAGTSGSSAHTAGALALLLQNQTHLTPSGARLILAAQAKVDVQTGAVPNNTYGYGKLDLKAGTTAVGDAMTRRFAFAPPFPNPTRGAANFVFEIPTGDLAALKTAPVVQIVDLAGRSVRVLSASRTQGIQRVTWDGKNASGVTARAGVYFARLVVGPNTAIRKFVRLD